MDKDFDLTGYQIVHLTPASMLHGMRIRLGLSQAQIAEKAGITQQMYQRFESGKRNLRTSSFEVTCKVLEALNMDITKFYHGEYVIGGEVYIGQDGQLHYVENEKRIDSE